VKIDGVDVQGDKDTIATIIEHVISRRQI